jgi:hypothetical protein
MNNLGTATLTGFSQMPSAVVSTVGLPFRVSFSSEDDSETMWETDMIFDELVLMNQV